MIDHFNLPVSDLTRSRRFYESVLTPLGVRFLMQDGDAVGFGTDTWSFGIVATPVPYPSLHLAFTASSRKDSSTNGLPGFDSPPHPHNHADARQQRRDVTACGKRDRRQIVGKCPRQILAYDAQGGM